MKHLTDSAVKSTDVTHVVFVYVSSEHAATLKAAATNTKNYGALIRRFVARAAKHE